jgi:hypothetical protein
MGDDEHTTVAAALHNNFALSRSAIAMSLCNAIGVIDARLLRTFGKIRSRRRGRQLDASTSTESGRHRLHRRAVSLSRCCP